MEHARSVARAVARSRSVAPVMCKTAAGGMGEIPDTLDRRLEIPDPTVSITDTGQVRSGQVILKVLGPAEVGRHAKDPE
jgi:hypothetical protein